MSLSSDCSSNYCNSKLNIFGTGWIVRHFRLFFLFILTVLVIVIRFIRFIILIVCCPFILGRKERGVLRRKFISGKKALFPADR
jgi:hypothetical protein